MIRESTAPATTRRGGHTGCLALTAIIALAICPDAARAADKVSFNIEVKPILAAKCFSCHGPDSAKRKGDLRLDVMEAALEAEAIVPGKPGESELITRITSTDTKEVMPPPSKHDAVTPAEIDILTRWIAQGGKYEKHWAFMPPVKPELPVLADGESPIDALARLRWEKQGLAASPEANREEWLRRVTFALTGLPPSPEEREAFLGDQAPGAHERVVDRLLASPRFGERMAIEWLDVARYGDTFGRHEDANCETWPWRDWVINAFNNNLPYDQFVRWQTAGDLMPHSTNEQVVATAFNRLPVQSNESGADPEEYRWDQIFDRVQTNATGVLGLTMHCARCHDHKYDPVSMKDYYGFAAFFSNIDELGLFSRFTNGMPAPTSFVYKGDEEENHREMKQKIVAAEERLKITREEARGRYQEWLRSHTPPREKSLARLTVDGRRPQPFIRPANYFSFDAIDPKEKVFLDDFNPSIKGEAKVRGFETPGHIGKGCFFDDEKRKQYGFPGVAEFNRTDAFSFAFWLQCRQPSQRAVILHRSRAGLDSANRGYELTFENGLLTATLGHFYPGNAIRIQAESSVDFSAWRHVTMTYDGSSRASGLKLFVDGRALPVKVTRDNLYKDIVYREDWGDHDNAVVADAAHSNQIILRLGDRTLDSPLLHATMDELRIYDRDLSPVEVARLAGQSVESNPEAWFDWYVREVDEPCRAAAAELKKARMVENDFSGELKELMVMQEMPGTPRPMPVLQRGDFRQPGDSVQPEIPAVLGSLPSDAPRNRLGLADWMASPQNPLTSRVQVNRLWRQFFGTGLVETQEDFGIQGRVPTHPELLDWLAVHFVESGWNIKALCREIALSQTYRRSSLPANTDCREKDPSNRWLARGPRFRLPAESLRDSALAAAGLLVEQIGGPSVYPPQPEGLWEDSGTQHVYPADKGDKTRRRSMYSFWRRTCPPPAMTVFDAPTREFCLARRTNTLTPLQSLALANEPGFLDAARGLAIRLVRDFPEPARDHERVDTAFLRLGTRLPSDAQRAAMTALLGEARAHYQEHKEEAAKLLAACAKEPMPEGLSESEVAATIIMVRALYGTEVFLTSK